MKNNTIHKIILGQMLGDGHIQLSSSGQKGILSISFGAKFLSYANYLIEQFTVFSAKIRVEQKRAEKIGKLHTGYKLTTLSFAELAIYHSIFYKLVDGRYIKIVPLNILEEMCPLVLAHLIMGDGGHSLSDGRTRIFTNSYTYDECVILARAIETNCGILCSVTRDRISKKTGISQYVLAIGKKQLVKLQELVAPHMHEPIKDRVGL